MNGDTFLKHMQTLVDKAAAQRDGVHLEIGRDNYVRSGVESDLVGLITFGHPQFRAVMSMMGRQDDEFLKQKYAEVMGRIAALEDGDLKTELLGKAAQVTATLKGFGVDLGEAA